LVLFSFWRGSGIKWSFYINGIELEQWSTGALILEVSHGSGYKRKFEKECSSAPVLQR